MMTNIGIVGGGPAGLMCAITAKRENPDLNIFIFEKNDIAATLLPTGGGRCNISHESDDIKTFAQNYPRGEKFLYGIFNRFFIEETVDFFKTIGIELYTQADGRMFPVSDKSLDVIFALKNEIKRLGIQVVKSEVKDFHINEEKFIVNGVKFDKITIATGGKNNKLLKSLSETGINITEQFPALSSFEISEKYLLSLAGVSLRSINAIARINKKEINIQGDILFTHKGVSGPLIYKISSLFARENYSKENPMKIILNFVNKNPVNLQEEFDKNPQKSILNLLAFYIPKSLVSVLLEQNNISSTKKCNQINKIERKAIEKFLTKFEIHATSPLSGGEIVSSGGVDLKEINPQTMECKKIKGLYFCGEILDIDGFCGGYNLQNCWSTGYIAGMGIIKHFL